MRQSFSVKNILKLSDSRGSSIVSVLVAGAAGTVIALAMMSLFSNMQEAQNNLKFRSDADNLNEEIRALLSSDEACINTFGGKVVVPGTSLVVPALKKAGASPGTAVYSAGKTYGDNSIVLEGFTLDSYAAGAASNKATMTLKTRMSSLKKSAGAQEVMRTVQVAIDKDSSNRITSCLALAKMTDGIWKVTPLNGQNIFFSGSSTGGRVGVGVSNPQAVLDVKGGIRAGADASGCGAANEGTLRYNSALKIMEFCNGTGWNAVMPSIKTVSDNCYCGPGPGPHGGCVACYRQTSGLWNGARYMKCPSGYTIVSGSVFAGGTDESATFGIDFAGNRTTCRGQGSVPNSAIDFVCQAICVRGTVQVE